MVLLNFFDTSVKCFSIVKLLSNVNPKCFRDDPWETLLLLKRTGGWQSVFSLLGKITSWSCLLESGLKLIFLWRCFILLRSLLSFEVVITESWIMEKTKLSSAKSLVLEDKPSAKSLIYIKNNKSPRMERWGSPPLALVHEKDYPFNTTLCFLFVKECFKAFNKLPSILFSCNIRPSCQTLSDAFEISRKTPLTS